MNDALVTGGAGFIGSHLAEALLDRGVRVTVLDDLSTGSLDNVAHLGDREGFSCVTDTVLNRDVLARLVESADVIFHLAAAVGVRLIVEQPVRTIETNVRGTEMILDVAVRHGKPVLITSTSEVYGKLDRPRFAEDDDLVLGPTSRPRWCYAASKILAESLALAHAEETGLPVTIVRLFNTIGPRQTGAYGMVVPRFVRQALRGEPITVYGDGRQRRSFTWVGDAVDAMIRLVQHADAEGEVFNVGHTDDISVGELAELIRELIGSESEITRIPFQEAYAPGFDDMPYRLPDLSKAQAVIGYRPSRNLRAMLEEIVAYESGRVGSRAGT